jgi:hypothetical protein
MADFFFFTDVDLLDAQTSSQAYGPAGVVSSTERFRVTSLHSATGSPKAYAVCDGIVCVQPDENPLLVNLILKPTEQPDLNLPFIKYFVYKGILKSSLFDGNEDIIEDLENDLLSSINASWDSYILSSTIPPDLPSTDPPSGKSLGIDLLAITNYMNDDPIDNLFYKNDSEYQFPSVKGGWVIGEFNTTAFGLTVLTENPSYNHPLKICRTAENFIEVESTGALEGTTEYFKHWHDKEAILNFIDPAVFFSSFYISKLRAKSSTGSFTKRSKNEIYDDILKGLQHSSGSSGSFYNRNLLYIDIRNEHNASFNYYKNYETDILLSLDSGSAPQTVNYYQSGWPILIITNSEFPTGNNGEKNDVLISLPEGDNTNPVVVVQSGYVKRINPFRKLKGKKRFFDLEFTDSFSNEIHLKSPNRDGLSVTTSVATLIIITYAKRLSLDDVELTSSGTKIESNFYFDNVFMPLQMISPIETNSGTTVKVYEEKRYVHQSDTGKELIMNIGVAEDVSGKYYFMFAKDRRKIPGFSVRKFHSFTSELILDENNFVNKIIENQPNFELTEKNIGYNSETLQLIKDNTKEDLSWDVFRDPSVDELFIIHLSNTEINDLEALVVSNELITDYKIFIAFANKTLEKVDELEFVSYDLILKGYKEVSTAIEANEINSNLKIYQYVS